MILDTILPILALILFLALLAYTAVVIIEEKRAYRENSCNISIGPFSLPIPSWWKSRGEGEYTHSHWRGLFRFIPFLPPLNGRELWALVQDKKIVFDEEKEKILSLSSHPQKRMEIVRLEGLATEDECQRVYLQVFLARCQKTGQTLYGEGKSPPLEGLVEGPYFEECILGLTLGLAEPCSPPPQ